MGIEQDSTSINVRAQAPTGSRKSSGRVLREAPIRSRNTGPTANKRTLVSPSGQILRVDAAEPLPAPKSDFSGGWHQQCITGPLKSQHLLENDVQRHFQMMPGDLVQTGDLVHSGLPRRPQSRSYVFVPGHWTDEELFRTFQSRVHKARHTGRRQSRIQPCWQVDEFRWPNVSDQFLSRHVDLIAQIGDSITCQLPAGENRIGICGIGRRTGKSLLSVCLARWLARSGCRVLLVDADIDNAKLTLFAGVEQRISWLESMARREAVGESLIESVAENITLAAIRQPRISRLARNAYELLTQVTKRVREDFDYVVVDIGDVNFLNQAGKFNQPVVDGAVIVHRQDCFFADQIELAQLRMRNRGIKPLAIVQNFAA